MTRNQSYRLAILGPVVLLLGVLPRPLVGQPPGQTPPREAPTITVQGREIPNTVEEILNPKHTVVVVHEMLNDFIAENGLYAKQNRRIDASAIVQPIAKLLAAARAKKVRVAYVRWTRHADGSTNADTQRRNPAARTTGGPVATLDGAWGWENIDELKPEPGDWIVRKYRPDAFFATPLEAFMRWNGVKTIVIVGIGAEVGVVPTVLTASNLGYFTVAVSDCLAPSVPGRLDDAMKYIGGPAIIKKHTEVIDIWQKSAPRPVVTSAASTPAAQERPQAQADGRQASQGEPPTITYEGREIPNTIEEILNPKHTALLVHEMLNDFLSKGGAYDQRGRVYDPARLSKIVPPIQKLIATARSKGVRVVYVRWTSHADGSTSSDPQRRGAGGRPSGPGTGVDGSWGWENIDAVKPAPGDWIVRKHRQDAFFGSPLDALLRWNGIKTIVFVGIGAEVGGVPTLMHASDLGYFRVAVGDCILSSNPDRMEDAMRFISGQATVKSHAEVIDIWARR